MKTVLFYKEINTNRWYIELPEWNGPKSDLEMVAGADTMLDLMSDGGYEVLMNISETEFENSNKLDIIRLTTDDIGEGALYKIEKYMGIEFNLEVWLCDVTKFVLGYFPNIIYLRKIN